MSNKDHKSFSLSPEIVKILLSYLQNKELPKNVCFESELSNNYQKAILHHGLTSFIYNHPSQGELHQQLKKILKNQYFTITLRNTQLFQTYTKITTAFELYKINYIPLKGAFLLPYIYNDTSARGMSDIDILIHPADYEKSKEILFKLGATQQEDNQSVFLQSLGHQYPPFWIFNTSVEIHSRLLPANLQYNIPVEDVWNHLIQYSQAGSNVENLDSYLLICYLALHIYYSEKRGEYRIYWYLDIFKVLESLQNYDASNLKHWLTKYGIEKPVYEILSKVIFLFNRSIIGVEPLSPKSEKEFCSQLALQTENKNSGYSIAIERVVYTKGIFNKFRYIFHTIHFGEESNAHTSTFSRSVSILKKLVNYLSAPVTSLLKR